MNDPDLRGQISSSITPHDALAAEAAAKAEGEAASRRALTDVTALRRAEATNMDPSHLAVARRSYRLHKVIPVSESVIRRRCGSRQRHASRGEETSRHRGRVVASWPESGEIGPTGEVSRPRPHLDCNAGYGMPGGCRAEIALI